MTASSEAHPARGGRVETDDHGVDAEQADESGLDARDVDGPAVDAADAADASDAFTVTLAPMRRRHLPRVLDHEAAVYPRPWTMGMFVSELARPESRSYIIARVGAVQVGHCGVLYVADEGHVTTVVVAPRWQQHGIATRMLDHQFGYAIDRGVDALTLEVRMRNTGARELYRRFGFVPAGVRKGYYTETGEDALVMWAHDISSDAARARRAAAVASLDGPTRLDNLSVSADARSWPTTPAAPATEDQDGSGFGS